MQLEKDFDEIFRYAHWQNWSPDWDVVQKIYKKFPESYSVLTPFAYTYLEEMIRSTTSQYGQEILDENGKEIKREVGNGLIQLAIKENTNSEYILFLREISKYFKKSTALDCGDNRNSVNHGYQHPRFWYKESFEQLIHDIAIMSKFSRF